LLESLSLPKYRRWILGGAVLLLPILLWFSWQRLAAFDWVALAQVYSQIDWRWMTPGAAIVVASYLIRALRWQVMLRPVTANSSLRRILSNTFIGFTAIVLFGRPGELVRPYLIARSENVPLPSQMAAWFLERVYDLLAVLILFGIGLAAFNPAGRPVGPALQWVLQTGGFLITLLGTACLIILATAALGGDILANRLRDSLAFLPPSVHAKIGGALTNFATGLASCGRPADIALIVVYTILEWATILGACICILWAFPQTESLSGIDVIVYLGFVSFGGIVQIPGIGGGTQIVGFLVFSQLFAVSAAAAMGIAMACWVATWVVVVPFGLLLAARQGLSWGALKKIDSEIAP
jgi:uncharacterized membrane protein YbhN (UPF0104 family)